MVQKKKKYILWLDSLQAETLYWWESSETNDQSGLSWQEVSTNSDK